MIKRVMGGLLIMGAVVFGMAAGVLLFLKLAPDRGQANPYEYNVEEFRKVPPGLIRYSETAPIKPAIAGLHGIAVDSSSRIYVAGDTAVAIFDKDGRSLGGFKLAEPGFCLAVGGQGNLYVGMKNHVEVCDLGGANRAAWQTLGDQAWITSIAAGSKQVFVADSGSRLVWKFSPSGELLGRLDGRAGGKGASGFLIPSPYFDVAEAPDGSVWIANTGLLRIECYNSDGRRVASWGKAAMTLDGFCGCCNPTHFALTPDGKFVTSEKGLPRVKVSDRNGNLDSVVAGPDQFARDAVGLDVAVDPAGRVLVLDPSPGRVRIFQRKM